MKTTNLLQGIVFTFAFGTLIIIDIQSCGSPQMTHEQLSGLGKSAAYFRDERSGLCFASWEVGLHEENKTITNVPCTPAVMQLSGGFKK